MTSKLLLEHQRLYQRELQRAQADSDIKMSTGSTGYVSDTDLKVFVSRRILICLDYTMFNKAILSGLFLITFSTTTDSIHRIPDASHHEALVRVEHRSSARQQTTVADDRYLPLLVDRGPEQAEDVRRVLKKNRSARLNALNTQLGVGQNDFSSSSVRIFSTGDCFSRY